MLFKLSVVGYNPLCTMYDMVDAFLEKRLNTHSTICHALRMCTLRSLYRLADLCRDHSQQGAQLKTHQNISPEDRSPAICT
eukprot:scaffold389122_cov26-Prasinocladus_malaysianus.AAC.1